MLTYKLVKNKEGIVDAVYRSDGWGIPMKDDNGEYQQYLKWLAEGNTPEPADE